MASITLAEASKLGLDDLVTGVIENIVTTNPIFAMLPFNDIDGNAKTYNREKTLGDAQGLDIGGTITAKAAATYKKKTASLTTLLGDAEVNGLIQAQRVGGDQVALQIASKAKTVGRLYQNLMITGDESVAGQFDGLSSIVDDIVTEADNPEASASAGDAAFNFNMLDTLLSQVKSKDGQVDFLLMNTVQKNKLRALQRALGGSTPEYVEVRGVNMAAYAGVPVLVNDWLVAANSPLSTEIYAGNFDDGSEKVGIAGLTSASNMGVHVQSVGASEDKDEDIFRVKFYSSFVVYNELGIARLTNVI